MTGFDDAIIHRLVARLSDQDNAEPATRFPSDAVAAHQPGLYSWWCDPEGLATLSVPLDADLPPLIYAGQAGATSTRSGAARAATLGSRLTGNHLRGNVSSSTFRKTLSSVLLGPLELQLRGPGSLDRASNVRVSDWMRAHLSVVTAPHPDRASLAAVETAVPTALDPPLNLMGMSPTPVRQRLSQLRSQVMRGH